MLEVQMPKKGKKYTYHDNKAAKQVCKPCKHEEISRFNIHSKMNRQFQEMFERCMGTWALRIGPCFTNTLII
jgi:hypothetical protein